MVRSCQSEQSVETFFDGLLRQRVASQVGLLVGKPNVGSRDLLLSVIRTPQQDGRDAMHCSMVGGPSAPSKGGKAKSGSGVASGSAHVTLDVSWVHEHAMQVMRMLPGGYQSALVPLAALLTDMSTHTSRKSGLGQSPSPPLLLHVDSATRKMSMREGDGSTPLRTAKPVELKFAPCLNQLVCLTCCHHVELELPVAMEGQQLKERLNASVAVECTRIGQSVPLLPGGRVPDDSIQVMDVLLLADAAHGSSSSGGGGSGGIASVDVALLVPLPGTASASGCAVGVDGTDPGVSHSELRGRVTLRGQVHGIAYATKREAVVRAIELLRADVQATLRYRADLVVEDAYGWEEERREADSAGKEAPPAVHPLLLKGKLREGASFALPARVLIPWMASAGVRPDIYLCDYLMPGEDAGSACERAAELLALDLADGPTAVLQPEALAHVRANVPLWRPDVWHVAPAMTPGVTIGGAASGGKQVQTLCPSYGVLGGAAVAVLAALAATLSLTKQSGS